jgi:hypothetical protein
MIAPMEPRKLFSIFQQVKSSKPCDNWEVRLKDYLSCFQPYWQIERDDSRRLTKVWALNQSSLDGAVVIRNALNNW